MERPRPEAGGREAAAHRPGIAEDRWPTGNSRHQVRTRSQRILWWHSSAAAAAGDRRRQAGNREAVGGYKELTCAWKMLMIGAVASWKDVALALCDRSQQQSTRPKPLRSLSQKALLRAAPGFYD